MWVPLGGGTYKSLSVSRLVATEFVSVPKSTTDSLLLVYHLDDDITNNRATNLKWKLNGTAVWQLDRNSGRRMVIFRNLDSAGEAVGKHSSAILHCLAGRQLTCGGYKWERASMEDVAAHLICGDDKCKDSATV